MLTENDVIAAVVAHLEGQGWTSISVSQTDQRGVDILMERDGSTIAVEAKGGTSSKQGTSRFGQPFTNNQKGSHVSRALYTAVRTVSEDKHRAAIAVPSDEGHERLIAAIRPALRTLEIAVFLVQEDHSVRELT